MCDPLTLGLMAAGGAISAGGAKMNANAQNEAIRAQNDANRRAMEINNQAREEEAVRQNQMFEQQLAEVTRTLAEANPAAAVERIQRTATSPENPIISQAGTYNATPLQGQYQNKAIADHSAGKVNESTKRSADLAKAIARLTALDVDANDVDGILAQGRSNISTIGSNRRGSMNANRPETNIQPAKITPSRSLAGDLMILGGGAAGNVAGQLAGGSSLADIIGRRG